ncbi:MAG: hypothetical protein EAX86_09210 [Candidatus Heimdallarchaeota archaeon]|nr:hypothetical protein [Candidatus Heimdallarchaeota archaeon]
MWANLSTPVQQIAFLMSSIWAIAPLIARIIAIMITGATGLVLVSYYFWNIADLTLGLFFRAFRLNTLAYSFLNFHSVPYLQFLFVIFVQISRLGGIVGILLFIGAVIELARSKQRKESITTTNIYSIIRHPQNVAFILMGLGYLFLLEVRLGDVFSWSIFTFIVIMEARWEEKRLLKQFPTEYTLYKTNTPFMIPLVRFPAFQRVHNLSYKQELGIGILIYLILSIPTFTFLESFSMGTFGLIS